MKKCMGKSLQVIGTLLIIVGCVIFFERPALAYADPGTGLLAVQAVGSAVIAAGWYLRRKIFSLFHRSAASSDCEVAYPATDEKQGTRLP